MENILEFVLYALALIAIFAFRAIAQKKKSTPSQAAPAEGESALFEKFFGMGEEELEEHFQNAPPASEQPELQAAGEKELEEDGLWTDERPSEPAPEYVKPVPDSAFKHHDLGISSSLADAEREAFAATVYEYKGDFEEIAAGEIGHEEAVKITIEETKIKEEIRKAVIYSEILKRKY